MSNIEPTTPHSPSLSARARRSRFTQINCVPWVPDRLLQQVGGACDIDSRFRRAVRLLAVLYMCDNKIESAASDGDHASSLPYPTLPYPTPFLPLPSPSFPTLPFPCPARKVRQRSVAGRLPSENRPAATRASPCHPCTKHLDASAELAREQASYQEAMTGPEIINPRSWNGKALAGHWLVTLKLDGVRAIWHERPWLSRANKNLHNIPPWREGHPRDCEVFVNNFRDTIRATRTRCRKEDTPSITQEHLFGLAAIDPRLHWGRLTDPSPATISTR